MKFFSMWYNRQTYKDKEDIKKLVRTGQLEFANGGWVAADEACPSYDALINNMALGHKFLKEEFDFTPRVGWHIDSFGHSSTTARLAIDFGFEAMFFARMTYDDIEQRI